MRFSPAFERDWKESYIDRMGLIVALSGTERFRELAKFKTDVFKLAESEQKSLKESLRQRFTPSNGTNGCKGGTEAVQSVL